jgi:hypothetical protein
MIEAAAFHDPGACALDHPTSRQNVERLDSQWLADDFAVM